MATTASSERWEKERGISRGVSLIASHSRRDDSWFGFEPVRCAWRISADMTANADPDRPSERSDGTMRKLAVLVLVAAAWGALFAALASRGGTPAAAQASSHREAPLISEDPSADNTDTYAFRSPDRPDSVTIISNYIPGEDPAAGPNWYTFSPSARYVIY